MDGITVWNSLIQIASVIIGAIIAFFSSKFLWKQQEDTKLRNLAHALYLEITQKEHYLTSFALMARSNLNADNYPIIPQELYPKDGLYFVFQREIASFDENLSYPLYRFYSNVLEAENERKLILEQTEKINMGTIDNRFDIRKGSFQRMSHSMDEAAILIPDILKKLETVFKK